MFVLIRAQPEHLETMIQDYVWTNVYSKTLSLLGRIIIIIFVSNYARLTTLLITVPFLARPLALLDFLLTTPQEDVL
jgi:hypothetical protein